jgi:hypothetical protein
MKKTLLVALCATVVLVGCATFPDGRFERSAQTIVDAINAGDVQELIDRTRTPFLLDGEIVILDRDIEIFWQNAIEAGFRVDEATADAVPLDEGSFRDFADTMEVRAFFERYITSKKGAVVELRTGTYRILLLLERQGMGDCLILGMKGPEGV